MSAEISREPSESVSGKKRKRGTGLVPEIVLTSDEGQITLRQLEILRAIAAEQSQKKAAERLRISPPVFNKQLKELERRASAKLVDSNPRGSTLTAEGMRLVRILDALSSRMARPEELVIGCTQISQRFAERSCTKLSRNGIDSRIIVADDQTNIALASGGLVDILFVDDPLFAYEYPREDKVHEVARDFLIHVIRGKAYARLSSGPQRIGFDHLRETGQEFDVKFTAHAPEELIGSKYSFFVSRLLLNYRNLELPANVKRRKLPYMILAVETTNHADIGKFFEILAPKQYYPIG